MVKQLDFTIVPARERQEVFSEVVRRGMDSTPKALPPRFFYDQRGSELFETITELPEYYLTRSEQAILETYADEFIRRVGGNLEIVEFGSGSSAKTRILIEAALAAYGALTYVPIDISADYLRTSAEHLIERYPSLAVHAISGEYSDVLHALAPSSKKRLFLFLGSNIGNFDHPEACQFLSLVRSRMGASDRLLVGFDLVKDPSIIEAAYNDSQGITAQFNKNLLLRINRELGGRFKLESFEHRAPYNSALNRIEMQLIALADLDVRVEDLKTNVEFRKGEAVHTEISQKYTKSMFESVAKQGALEVEGIWQDERSYFAVALLKARFAWT